MTRLTLSEIWIYPIKSLAGIRLQRSNVKQKGLVYDRRWMLVDEDGRFLTQREHPEMSQFQLTMDTEELTILNRVSSQLIVLDLKDEKVGESLSTIVWDDEVEAIEVGHIYSQWFSDQLQIKCKLVFFPETHKRDIDPDYATMNEQVSLADGYPFLIIGQASLDDLNKRLKEPIPMNRFRPNFVFTGGEPFEEDRWKNFIIGSNRFIAVKPCSRCVLTTVDQRTGVKGTEPLATLATYRKYGSKINFGQNLLAIDYDEIQEGDEIGLEA
ncbi:MAG TPA: MOSC domain-containing protein [Cyclobacteriaceae bacterium]|nr:MOSC domain-containing protein [Cyclobacteriaceae bacterium]HPW60960.1 MOSC domain-containing protein [Cyclobacteriaceae bacterium]